MPFYAPILFVLVWLFFLAPAILVVWTVFFGSWVSFVALLLIYPYWFRAMQPSH